MTRTQLLLVATWVVGCNAMVGVDNLEYTSSGGGTGGTTTSSGGGTGGGGTGGAGTGGTGGDGAGAPCDLFPDDCPAEEKCSVVNEDIGYPGGTACILAGPRGPWTRCTEDSQCARNLVCDRLNQVCRPLCVTGADCLDEGTGGPVCIPIPKHPEIGPIPGIRGCIAHCHPFTGQPCSDAHGAMTCVPYWSADDTDCIWTEGRSPGAECTTASHCARGSLCIDYCAVVCTPPGGGGDPADDCSIPSNCTALNPGVTHEGEEFGICFEL
ncbi:MAG: hypothetical protein JRI68_25250 [Deltaproteobacteria bacterium]|nr:hypothetical protein [Deltaproteobacteria bacterium]